MGETVEKDSRPPVVIVTGPTASGKTPVVEYVVDPDVLGGLILQVGELRMDNSLRRHLRVARKRLLERADLGLEAGARDE